MKNFIQFILLYLLSQPVCAQSIAELEYFFDTDPGAGSGAATVLAVPLDSLDATSSISTAGLAPGFHQLFYRVKDVTGNWGLFQKRSFYVTDNTQNSAGVGIHKLEYFFDSDPGAGGGPTTTFPLPQDSLNSSASLVTNSLAPGFHTLNYRVRDVDGVVSLFKKHTFYVQDTTSEAEEPLTEMAYYLDGGPGVSTSALTSGIASLDTADLTISLPLSLSPGFHYLHIESRNVTGEWGLYQTRTFFVSDSASSGPASPLTGLEYYVDADPGAGAGDFLPVGPVDSLDSLLVLPTQAGLSLGWHQLSLRVQDAAGAWSFAESDSFQVFTGCSIPAPEIQVAGSPEICPGDSVQLSVPPVYASYSWSNGATSSSVWVTSAGSYAVTVTDTAGCAGFATAVGVSLLPAPEPVILVNGQTEFCTGDSVGLITDAIHESYFWSTGDTTAFTFITQTGSYFVTVTEDGCPGISEPVSLFAIEVPTPTVVQIAADSLQSDLVANTYTWYFNSTVLPVSTRTIQANQSGIYQVQLTNEIGCVSDKSEFFSFTATGLPSFVDRIHLRVFPNPGSGLFTLEFDMEKTDTLALNLLDATGRSIGQREISGSAGANSLTIDLQGQAAGIYYLRLRTRSGEGGISLLKK